MTRSLAPDVAGEPRCSPGDLIDLARPASEARAMWSAQDLAAIWRHQLATQIADEIPGAVAAATGSPSSFAEVLRDPRPPVELLRAVKDYAKQLEHDESRPVPREIAWALYLAAVVAARARCGQRITSTDDAAVRQWVDWAVAQPWVDEQTRALIATFARQGGAPT